MNNKLILFVTVLLFTLKSSAQCAMCRAVLESEEGQSTAKGINDGIVYLMIIPYVLFFGFAYFMYKKYNKKSN